ncbi:MAG: hypothetical protein ACO3YY_03320 [Phycisphaerales bacterium]
MSPSHDPDPFDSDDLDPEGPDAADLARFGGDTVGCPACGGEVHDLSDRCPECGHWIDSTARPDRAGGGWRSGLLWVVILSLAGVGWVLLRMFR